MSGRSEQTAAAGEWVESSDVRLLRRVSIAEGPTGTGDPDSGRIGLAIDVETTGLDLEKDQVIELAMRWFRFDEGGRMTRIGERWSWLQDPATALEPDIVKLTGLTDDILFGREIDEDAASRAINGASIVIAHNAAFDRPRVERRLPDASGQHWACTYREIDWRGRGLQGGSLAYLLMQAGMFNEAHRAAEDVDSLIALLRHEVEPGRTALADLLECSERDTWVVRAEGAAFERKDDLKARGYQWDANGRVWWKELADRESEEWWLAANVYAASASPKRMGPEWKRVTSRERWAGTAS